MFFRSVCFGLIIFLVAGVAAPQSLGTAFTYQGQLTEFGEPAHGLYDVQVCLFDSPSNPVPIACVPDFNEVPVEAGVFTITLDFGASAFAGQQRFLELRVRSGASTGAYTILDPRQALRPTPEALRASFASAVPWSGLTGTPAAVTSITAGTGLSGGTITGSGTIGIAGGGVGLAQINTAQVQARVAGTCAPGSYLRGINADGSAVCTDLPGVNIATTVDPANFVGGYSSMAIGADGLPVISYWDAAEAAVKVAKCGNAACTGAATITTVDNPANEVGEYTAIAIGTDGIPVISYWDFTARALKVAKCGNAACAGPATITTVDDPAGNGVGRFNSIAIGNDGLPVISYFDDTARDLKVAKCGNAACTGPATITIVDGGTGFVGWPTSVAIGADGLPVIGYRDSFAGALKVAKCGNAACTGAATITTVDDPPNSVGAFVSIAIGTDGLPVIGYFDSIDVSLKVAKCGNAACTGASTITTVEDASGELGWYTSIAIGADGFPVVSSFDQTAGALKVVKCGNAACTGAVTIATVDIGLNIQGLRGGEHSIAIGSDGLPVISYLDGTARSLKVTKCGTPTCQ